MPLHPGRPFLSLCPDEGTPSPSREREGHWRPLQRETCHPTLLRGSLLCSALLIIIDTSMLYVAILKLHRSETGTSKVPSLW